MESSGNRQGKGTQLIKIGAIATKYGVSVDLLRLYEREGLLIPIKSPKGTRYFGEQDYLWIETLMKLVRDSGLNFAGIRHLLALLPCWTMKHCKMEHSNECPAPEHPIQPCWITHSCCQTDRECYGCEVYRAAPQCTNLRPHLRPKVQYRAAAD